MGDWTLDPLQLAPLVLVGVAYGVRARTLARRGTPVPRWRMALFALGLLLFLTAIVSPIAARGEERFSFHMVQHLLLGDLAPLALLAGLTGPLLRPVLALRPVHALRVLAHPLVALPIWIANVVFWHLPFAYEAAIRHDLVHAVEHISFFAAGLVMWMPVLETLPAPAWFGSAAKLAYIVVVRLVGTLIANVFVWSGEVFYAPVRGRRSLRPGCGGRRPDGRRLARHLRRVRVALPEAVLRGRAPPGAPRAGNRPADRRARRPLRARRRPVVGSAFTSERSFDVVDASRGPIAAALLVRASDVVGEHARHGAPADPGQRRVRGLPDRRDRRVARLLGRGHLGSASWLSFFQWTTIAYILSRGVAKASRVLEQ